MKWIETITPKQAAEELGSTLSRLDEGDGSGHGISEDQKYSVMSRFAPHGMGARSNTSRLRRQRALAGVTAAGYPVGRQDGN